MFSSKFGSNFNFKSYFFIYAMTTFDGVSISGESIKMCFHWNCIFNIWQLFFPSFLGFFSIIRFFTSFRKKKLVVQQLLVPFAYQYQIICLKQTEDLNTANTSIVLSIIFPFSTCPSLTGCRLYTFLGGSSLESCYVSQPIMLVNLIYTIDIHWRMYIFDFKQYWASSYFISYYFKFLKNMYFWIKWLP